MHWEIAIIPLIALGVWIIGTLFKSEDEKLKKGVGRRGNASSRAPGRRVGTDLDRFLEEARRRREPEERRKAPPSPARDPAPRPPLRERPSQPREMPRRPAPLIAKEEVVVALPAPRPVAPPPVAEPVASLALAREASLPPPPTSVTRPAPIPQQVLSLLSKPQSAATAFVLREIFDRPLCKRRR
ncbi:MAG TPA: hypothetical protein VMG10_14040 [Gemmataceae bacterium]|nr:hypothetical protein [Gemmataceae bacterium]